MGSITKRRAADPKGSKLTIHIGNELLQARQSQQLTMAELAVAAGLSQASISDLENGNKTPTADTLLAISVALDVPLSHWFHRFAP